MVLGDISQFQSIHSLTYSDLHYTNINPFGIGVYLLWAQLTSCDRPFPTDGTIVV